MQKAPYQHPPRSAERAVAVSGGAMLAALLGMSLGTALLPPGALLPEALLVIGGLFVLLGSALWVLHVTRERGQKR